MKTITIPEDEYLKMQQTIHTLQAQVKLLNDQKFLKQLALAYHYFFQRQDADESLSPISLKRGSAKTIIRVVAQ